MIRVLVAGSLAAAAVLAGPAAFAQQQRQIPSITVTPQNRYYGAYGPALPGVYMLSGTGISAPAPLKHAPINTNEILPARETYQNPLPWLDAWHGNYAPPQLEF